MKHKIVGLLVLFLVLLPLHSVQAQEPTSRHIPFTLQTLLTPDTTQEVEVQLWDMASGGTLIFSESYTGENALPVDSSGSISFRFGSRQTPAGLNPAHFPSGSSRYLDVIDVATQASVLPSGRIPLFANAFALSGGGGGGGGVSDVTGSAPVVVSSPTADTRNVALGPITEANIADNAVITPKIADGAVNLLKLAAGSVDSSKIVAGSVGSAAVNSGQVQLRVTGNCPPGSSIRTIDANGGVTCETGSGGGVGGSGTVNQIPKFTASTTIGNSAITEVNGNVGIGVAAPLFKLHVDGGLAFFRDVSMRNLDISSAGELHVVSGPPLDPTTRFKVALNGNVGIGTPNPAARLHVTGPSPVRILGDTSTLSGSEFVDFMARSSSFSSDLGGMRIQRQPGSGDIDTLILAARSGGSAREVMRVKGSGEVSVNVLQIQGGSDLSESFDVNSSAGPSSAASSPEVKPGLVVSIDPQNPGKLIVSHQAYDHRAAGIVSGAGGLKPGMVMGQEGSIADGKWPVALSGRVWVYCDATRYAIKPGDLLTTSRTPGHAMRVASYAKAKGAIIGKAMTELKSGRGLVLVLVTLQ